MAVTVLGIDLAKNVFALHVLTTKAIPFYANPK